MEIEVVFWRQADIPIVPPLSFYGSLSLEAHSILSQYVVFTSYFSIQQRSMALVAALFNGRLSRL
eukprot:scaffold26659_cov225-Skeletonema_menzelii.AAC.8